MDKSRRQSNSGINNQKEGGSPTLFQLIPWLRKSFEFRGKASARKLTVFFCFVLLNIGFIDHLYTAQQIQVEFIIIYSLIILLGLGFMTAENIVAIVKGRFGAQTIFTDENYSLSSRSRVDNPDGIQPNDSKTSSSGYH
jgi:hypothetical protein